MNYCTQKFTLTISQCNGLVTPPHEWICKITSRVLDGRASDVQECRSLCAACRPGEWLRVDSNGINGKPTFRWLANRSWVSTICNHFRNIAAWNPKSFKIVTQKLPFWKKDPLWEDFPNMLPKGFTTSQILVLCVNFVKFGWLEIGKVVHYVLDKKKQNFASLSRSRFCVDRAQNLPGPAPDNYSECPKFHPNPFTSGGVIAERTIKCFQYSVKLASSPSNELNLFILSTVMLGYLNLINVDILVCLLEFLDSNFHRINLVKDKNTFSDYS